MSGASGITERWVAAESDSEVPAATVLVDPALEAVRAVVAASPQPLAVFDGEGGCIAANRHFLLRAAGDGGGADRLEQRTLFKPDQRRQSSSDVDARQRGRRRTTVG